MTPTDAFWQARKFLIANREDYDRAYAGFRWPELETFNWALDWFDVYARSNNRTALWVATRDAGQTKLSFRELSDRSNQVANFLRGYGVGRGDRLLLMLSNVVPFWEVMLASIKLGAVVVPATTMIAPRRAARPLRARRHRPRRGRIRATPASSPRSRATTRGSPSASRPPAG